MAQHVRRDKHGNVVSLKDQRWTDCKDCAV